MESRERLQRLLGGAELADLRKRLRRRYELGGASGIAHLTGLSAGERAALAGLLGRPQRDAASMRVDIAALDAVLRRGRLAGSLRDALEILDGPIVNRSALHAAEQEQWSTLRESCHAGPLGVVLGSSKGLGLLKRLAGGDPRTGAQLCERAQRVLARLPAPGVPRARLAAEILGDAHALDQGRPVATLVLAALRFKRNDDAQDDMQPLLQSDDKARDVWASAGVLLNELARPALFLNLPAAGRAFAAGEPSYLSLRSLLRAPPQWEVAGRAVFVCENPNFVAIAADALGATCAPLACTDGMPAAAQRVLLMQLAEAGAELHYHGDFDWPGLGVGNIVMREFNAQPWRYRAQDYRLALAVTAGSGNSCLLGTAEVNAIWDTDLMVAMRSGGQIIHEEAVADFLLPDLSTGKKIET